MSAAFPETPVIAVVGARIALPEGVLESGTLTTYGGKIVTVNAEITALSDVTETIEGRGLILLPGFLDLHIHGGGGADTMDATPDALRTILRTHVQHGTTGLLATTITQGREKICAALANVRQAWEAGAGFCPDGAQVLGVHLEGPYISPQKPGAQPKQYVRPYDAPEFASWHQAAGGFLRLITLAPEEPDANALIDACLAANIVVSLGHTDATAPQTAAAVERGARQATHLFNAMPPIHHRNPGPIPVLLTDTRVRAEVICDGHHIAPEIARLVYAAKGPTGMIAITDAMSGAGAEDGIYDLGGNEVTVEKGKALLADGTLAGSVLTMDRAAAHLRDWLSLGDRWDILARLTATNAADQMGWAHKGSLVPGADADFVLVDDDLTVYATYIAGRCVYRRPPAMADTLGPMVQTP